MDLGRKIDRRKMKSRALRLSRPIFMQVPKPLAASCVSGAALAAIFASHANPTIAFGPFFLLICAFGAWLVGNRFALLLGGFIAVVQVAQGNAVVLNGQPFIMALQFSSALAVVLMLGVARAALELEWRYARIDPLTGALNRKAFFEASGADAGQEGIRVLIFADVDGLKRVNDRFGHEAGDEALRDFADRVRNAIRKDDIFARIGGDEFVVSLKVRDTAAAELVAQRLNRVLNLDAPENEKSLKCSLGALALPSGSRSIDAELRQADALMYHAKREGIGLVMAISVKGDIQQLVPTVSVSEQIESEVRTRERTPQHGSGDRSPAKSVAA